MDRLVTGAREDIHVAIPSRFSDATGTLINQATIDHFNEISFTDYLWSVNDPAWQKAA
ncbi:MAG: hypothetical protein KGZ83_16360 [Sulfuricella sp.]|nr:hypothetical protein [Sulfuricella sp.]